MSDDEVQPQRPEPDRRQKLAIKRAAAWRTILIG